MLIFNMPACLTRKTDIPQNVVKMIRESLPNARNIEVSGITYSKSSQNFETCPYLDFCDMSEFEMISF